MLAGSGQAKHADSSSGPSSNAMLSASAVRPLGLEQTDASKQARQAGPPPPVTYRQIPSYSMRHRRNIFFITFRYYSTPSAVVARTLMIILLDVTSRNFVAKNYGEGLSLSRECRSKAACVAAPYTVFPVLPYPSHSHFYPRCKSNKRRRSGAGYSTHLLLPNRRAVFILLNPGSRNRSASHPHINDGPP